MVFRDQMLVCQECGKSYVFTVVEQRRQADQVGEENIQAPLLCSACRRKGPLSPLPRQEHVEHLEDVERTEQVEQVEVSEPERWTERPRRKRRTGPRDRAERVQDQEPASSASTAPILEVEDFPLQEAGIELKLIGDVKWFNRSKGYGFVTMADGEEVFFHRSDVAAGDLAQIKDGIQVEFQVRRTDKGIEAFNVSVLPSR